MRRPISLERVADLPGRLPQMHDMDVLIEARDCLAAFCAGQDRRLRFALNLLRPRVETILARLRIPHHVVLHGQLVDVFDDVLAENFWGSTGRNESLLLNALERGIGALLVAPPPIVQKAPGSRRWAAVALLPVAVLAVVWWFAQRPTWMVLAGLVGSVAVAALIYWWLTRDLLRRVALTSLGAAVAVVALPSASMQVHDGTRRIVFELNAGSVVPALGFMALCGLACVLSLRSKSAT